MPKSDRLYLGSWRPVSGWFLRFRNSGSGVGDESSSWPRDGGKKH